MKSNNYFFKTIISDIETDFLESEDENTQNIDPIEQVTFTTSKIHLINCSSNITIQINTYNEELQDLQLFKNLYTFGKIVKISKLSISPLDKIYTYIIIINTQ